jgi:hypothetical protein
MEHIGYVIVYRTVTNRITVGRKIFETRDDAISWWRNNRNMNNLIGTSSIVINPYR